MAENTRELKRRMRSIESTEHITNAMRLVSAAKFRKAKSLFDQKSLQLREVTETMELLLAGQNVSEREKPCEAASSAAAERVLAIVICSDRGLCGGFNSNLIKTAVEALREYKKEAVKLVCIGGRGRDFFAREGYEIDAAFTGAAEKISFSEIVKIVTSILADYRSGRVDSVLLVTTEYINSLRQEPVVKQLLPAEFARASKKEEAQAVPAELEYAPSKEAVTDYLLPKYLELTLLEAFLESAVCEHATRRGAMESATDNAREILNRLSLTYHRARQAAITNELIEIVSGAETRE